MKNEKWYIYVLQCRENRLYTGITKDVERRVHEHQHTEKGAKFTKYWRPVSLLVFQECEGFKVAQYSEIQFKKLKATAKWKRIKAHQEGVPSLVFPLPEEKH